MICRFYKLKVSHPSPSPSHPTNDSQSFWFNFKIFSRSTLAAGPQSPLSGPEKQVGTFLSLPGMKPCNHTKRKQNTANCEQTETKHSISWQHMETVPIPPPNISTEIPPLFRKIFDIFRGIPKDVFIHSRFLVYTPTMVCTSLGFHGTLVGKHWCTLQESYAYAISVAVQKGISDIRMHA